jgi:hypothetical protein
MNEQMQPASNSTNVFRVPESLLEVIAPDLSRFVRTFPWDFRCKYEPAESKNEILLKLSETRRRQLIGERIDLQVAVDKRNIRLPRGFAAALSKRISDHLVAIALVHSATVSGCLLYPPAGWMGWHTNSDRVGWRLYVNYTTTGGCSFFRWSQKGEIRTDYDSAGFNFRIFRIGSQSELLWHCIYADDWRFSLGFAVTDVACTNLLAPDHPLVEQRTENPRVGGSMANFRLFR